MRIALLATVAVSAPLLGLACGSDPSAASNSVGGGGVTVSSSSAGGATSTSTTTSTSTSGPGGAGGAGGAGGGPDNGHPSDIYPAPHPDPPSIVNRGGPILKTPRVVPIFFANEDPMLMSKVVDFTNNLGASSYWTQTAGIYGVAPLEALAPIQLTIDPGAVVDADTIGPFLADKIMNDPAFPMPDGNTIYMFQFPDNTTITEGGGTVKSCQSFGGFHWIAATPMGYIPFIASAYCSPFHGNSGIDSVTATLSHELVEAATNPQPLAGTQAFSGFDDAHFYWSDIAGDEVGDICAPLRNEYSKVLPFDYTVQHIWSNAAALAGHDPCVPQDPNIPYFNSAAVLNDDIMIPVMNGSPVTSKGVSIPVGGSKTIELDLFSDRDTKADIVVDAKDWASYALGQAPHLSFQFDRKKGRNGEKLHLTITRLKASADHYEIFFLTNAINPVTHYFWVGAVGD